MKHIVFFYTFDPTDLDNGSGSDNINMLYISITSVRQEFPNATIVVYTTKVQQMREYIGEFCSFKNFYIENVPAKFLISEIPGKYPSIGNSRMWILQNLINKYQNQYIVYLDNDTYFHKNSKARFLKIINSVTNPIGFTVESWQSISEFLSKFRGVDTTNVWPHDNLDKLHCINNGVQIYPPNSLSKYVVADTISVYNKLVSHYRSEWMCQVAFSLVLHRYRFPKKALHDFPDNYKILTHYYIGKSNYKHQINKCFYRHGNADGRFWKFPVDMKLISEHDTYDENQYCNNHTLVKKYPDGKICYQCKGHIHMANFYNLIQ